MTHLFAILGLATAAILIPAGAIAQQQKTAKECRDEWRADKAAMQANGTTEKAYIQGCRSDGAVNPSANAARDASDQGRAAGAASETKTAKACRDEWRAAKQAMQASGKTEKAYVDECRAGASSNAAAPMQKPAEKAVAPVQKPAEKAAAPVQRPAEKAAAQPAVREHADVGQTGATQRSSEPSSPRVAGQFATEAEAKTQCRSDLVVWANRRSKIYHYAGSSDYGTTKNGAYMCESQSTSGGFRAAKNEKRPS